MAIQIKCSSCGAEMMAPDTAGGKLGRCACGAIIRLPSPQAANDRMASVVKDSEGHPGRNRMFWILGVLLVAAIFIAKLTPFGGSRDPVDQCLDQFEKVVNEWSARADAGSIGLDDLTEINKLNIDFGEKLRQLHTNRKWTVSQNIRHFDLSVRFSKIMSKMSSNPPRFSMPEGQ